MSNVPHNPKDAKKNGNGRAHAPTSKSGVVKVKPNPDNSALIYGELAAKYPDFRIFGGTVPRLVGTGRGPVQVSPAESIDPVTPTRDTITRVAVATEKEERRQDGANRGMGGIWFVPYGLYRFHVYINPTDAKRTLLTEGDYADLFLPPLVRLFDNDRASGRTGSCVRAIYEFRHVDFEATQKPSCAIGGEALLETIEVVRDPSRDGPARHWSHYQVKIRAGHRASQDFSFREIVSWGGAKIDLPTVALEKKDKLLSARIELVVLVDFKNSNPQGDPDNENCPRTDPETGNGRITCAGIKRKIRDNLAIMGHPIYMARGACLGRTNREVAESVGCGGVFSGDESEEADIEKTEAETSQAD